MVCLCWSLLVLETSFHAGASAVTKRVAPMPGLAGRCRMGLCGVASGLLCPPTSLSDVDETEVANQLQLPIGQLRLSFCNQSLSA